MLRPWALFRETVINFAGRTTEMTVRVHAVEFCIWKFMQQTCAMRMIEVCLLTFLAKDSATAENTDIHTRYLCHCYLLQCVQNFPRFI